MPRIFQRPKGHVTKWATTHWSRVRQLAEHTAPEWQRSWEHLVEVYHRPMRLYVQRILSLVRRNANAVDQAEEVVQAFLATCCEKDWLRKADPAIGRFRAFIQVLLRRYTYSYLRSQSTQRRTPRDARLLSLVDVQESEPPAPDSAAALAEFNEGWVKVAVARALEKLSSEHDRYPEIIRDLISTSGAGSSDLCERLGVRQKQLAVMKHRARRQFSQMLLTELEATVSDAAAFEEELAALRPYLP